jgi:putative oxidoreductase
MKPNIKIEKNTRRKIPLWLTFIRIILGLLLFCKGILFISDSSGLASMLHSARLGMSDGSIRAITYIIPYVNLLGGLFIAVGLFTRWAALIQIPILFGAIFFLNTATGVSIVSMNSHELLLSVIVLILLVVFVIKGSGFISADEYFNSYYKAGAENDNTKNFFV